MGASAETTVPYADYVRLHVLAEDDTQAAQNLKIRVRDAIIQDVLALFEDCASSEEAWAAACDNIGLIEKWAQSAASENGYTGKVTAEADLFEYEARQYGNQTVPAGEYRSVRISIGAGEGQNWWCVLYPGLCLPEDYVPGMKVEFYSSILRWLESLFGGNENG